MKSFSLRTPLQALLISSSVALVPSVMAMDLIVYESDNSHYTAGSSINSESTIELIDGQTLTLISPNGNIIKLTGPHNKTAVTSAVQHEKGVSDTLKIILSANKTNSKDLGVTRSSTDIIRNSKKHGWVPEPWVVNINRSGDNCVLEDQAVKLWRSGTDATQLKLSMGDEFSAYKDLQQDENFIIIPKEMPVRDGGSYQFTMDNNQIETTWHVIPKGVSSVPVYAAWMQKSGCHAQATAMLKDYKLK